MIDQLKDSDTGEVRCCAYEYFSQECGISVVKTILLALLRDVLVLCW